METLMRVGRLAWLLPLCALAGCGGSSDKPEVALSLTCSGNTVLNGARSIDVLGDPVNGRTTLSFPDPVNPGKTGTISVPSHDRCRISPTPNTGR
jgi:hypothetical protein